MAHARFICLSSRPAAAYGVVARTQGPLWRLVGANNRELGRMPLPVLPGQTCCGAVAQLLDGLNRAVPRVKLAGPATSWTWALEIDSAAAAVSGRAYLRQRECQYSLDHFLKAAADAVFNDAHCLLAGSGRR
jgi:hypothetical protein